MFYQVQVLQTTYFVNYRFCKLPILSIIDSVDYLFNKCHRFSYYQFNRCHWFNMCHRFSYYQLYYHYQFNMCHQFSYFQLYFHYRFNMCHQFSHYRLSCHCFVNPPTFELYFALINLGSVVAMSLALCLSYQILLLL